mmetsp:Transcript_25812/g.38134  ORF Transcript_25812/g.38134 Transcript_25812/m.38134 type:complete len:337 (-) Transcript_25812:310-1320(-)|eukprot:CAMPEP_0195522454 /NCGR_PEP_ID=MMETSP0794_2-20130614/20652_1 /TAXON_ID=515487 /ORGANISM="Stephanopyxis turris, Strain CCMP 815" /LENGTH=336 /DNA_ID=CAMNT_0040652217 /DNA_START=123 /DNA_END=1133 /DNA_ORIENTATION=+
MKAPPLIAVLSSMVFLSLTHLIFTSAPLKKQVSKELMPSESHMRPTYADVAYDKKHVRTKLDFWKAPGKGPRPIAVFVVGVGWEGGDKEWMHPESAQLSYYLERGVSCASVNYRRLTLESTKLPVPAYDVARAIQFLRSKAKKWNIDKEKVVLIGGSFGGAISLFINNFEDMADPKAWDKVSHESTRISGVWAQNAQTTIDPKQIQAWFGQDALQMELLYKAVGEDDIHAAMKKYPDNTWLYRRFSAFNHASKDNPPILMTYNDADLTRPCKDPQVCYHHPYHGIKMKEKCDEVGQECHLLIKGVQESDKYTYGAEFVLKTLIPDYKEPAVEGVGE